MDLPGCVARNSLKSLAGPPSQLRSVRRIVLWIGARTARIMSNCAASCSRRPAKLRLSANSCGFVTWLQASFPGRTRAELLRLKTASGSFSSLTPKGLMYDAQLWFDITPTTSPENTTSSCRSGRLFRQLRPATLRKKRKAIWPSGLRRMSSSMLLT